MRRSLMCGLLAGWVVIATSPWATADPAAAMSFRRSSHTATLLPSGEVLVAGGRLFEGAQLVSTASAELFDPASGQWRATGSMAVPRRNHSATLMPDGRVLVVGGLSTPPAYAFVQRSAEIYDPRTGQWTSAGDMAVTRELHTASLLQDGRVLVAGGRNESQTHALLETFEPGRGWTTPWRLDPVEGRVPATLLQRRQNHTATVVQDGRVLIVGGRDGSALASVEIFDPNSGLSSPAPDIAARWGHTATMLPTGEVLVAGGFSSPEDTATLSDTYTWAPGGLAWAPGGDMPNAHGLHSAVLLPDDRVAILGGRGSPSFSAVEVYEAGSGWTSLDALEHPRQAHTSTVLPDGSVLVAGGIDFIYDSASVERLSLDTFAVQTMTPMQDAVSNPTLTTLPDGRVLRAGGVGPGDVPSALAEIFDPVTGAWTPLGSMIEARWNHSAILLPSGLVLVVGGFGPTGIALASTEFYDPQIGQFVTGPSMLLSRAEHTSTLLADGTVLVTGGWTGSVADTTAGATAFEAEVFDPLTASWSPTGAMRVARAEHTATLLKDGRVLVVGGFGQGASGAGWQSTAEIWEPGTGAWTVTSSMQTERAQHAAALLTDGRVLVTGGVQYPAFAPIMLSTAELFDPVRAQWDSASDMLEPRAAHAMATLGDDTVLVLGGGHGRSFDGTNLIEGVVDDGIEQFDPRNGSWTALPNLQQARFDHSIAVLPDDRIVVAGGVISPDALDVVTASIEIVGHVTPADPPDPDEDRRPRALGIIRAPRAEFDATRGAPSCPTAGWSCDSHRGLQGRGTVPGGAEQHAPNNVGASCADGNSGTYRFDESVERIRVYSLDERKCLLSGTAARVEVTVWAWGDGSSDALDLFASSDAADPQWSTLASPIVPSAGGLRILATEFTLGPSGMHAIRARFRFEGAAATCGVNNEVDDVDDLVFRVADSASECTQVVKYGEPFAIHGDGFDGARGAIGGSEAGGGGHSSSSVNYPLIRLTSVGNDRATMVVPDDALNFSDELLALQVSRLPPGLDLGWHRVSVTTAGITQGGGLVRLECGLSIAEQPSDTTVELGQPATFRVDAPGAREYQWMLDDQDLPGAVEATLTTAPTVASDSGARYSVRVKSPCSEMTSDPATLRVSDGLPPVEDDLSVVNPGDGDYWLRSPAAGPMTEKLVSWSMSDDFWVCRVRVSLWYSNEPGQPYVEATPNASAPANRQLPRVIGTQGCVFADRIDDETQLLYQVPTTFPSGREGSRYRIKLEVTDHGGNTTSVESGDFFIVGAPNPDSVRTLLLWNKPRLLDMPGATSTDVNLLAEQLQLVARHGSVQGVVVDVGAPELTSLEALYDAWDTEAGLARTDPSHAAVATARANDVLFGPGGIQSLVRTMRTTYSRIRYVVVAGDDRIIPMARFVDGTPSDELPESEYPAGGDLRARETTVAQALSTNHYLSDDPLGVAVAVSASELLAPSASHPRGRVVPPSLSVGRLVETVPEIRQAITTFLSQNGFIDLTSSAIKHKVLVTGYDFLVDAGKSVRTRWKTKLGLPDADVNDGAIAPADGALVADDWGANDATVLRRHLSGNEGQSGAACGAADRPCRYAVASLAGHAAHHIEGVPTGSVEEIDGLAALEIHGVDSCAGTPSLGGALDLSGAVIYSTGCHGGLPVPGSCSTDADHSLDLAQTYLSRGAGVYVGNTGYGWGLKKGLGYTEKLSDMLTENLVVGGTVAVGDALVAAKRRYYQEAPYLDESRYDAFRDKVWRQWTLYGLPMYSLRTASPSGSTGAGSPTFAPARAPMVDELPRVQAVGSGTVTAEQITAASIPTAVTQLSLHFDFQADGVYTKKTANGESVPPASPCPDAEGCYYELNGLSSDATDLPIQPYFVYDSRLSGTSQRGVLWTGSRYTEETGFKPVIAELSSNGGNVENLDGTPRRINIRSTAPTVILGQDECRPSDTDLNSLVVTTGEAAKADAEASDPRPLYTIERLHRELDFDVFYFKNTTSHCDRGRPVFGAGPYHVAGPGSVLWSVRLKDATPPPGESEADGVWRVVVVWTDGTLELDPVSGRMLGRWSPVELSRTGSSGAYGMWTGELITSGAPRVSYVVQAVDRRGNVSTLTYVASDGNPASGVPLGVPRVVQTWDDIRPTTTIASGPSGTITTTQAGFEWEGFDDQTLGSQLVYAYRLAPLESTYSAFGAATSRSWTGLASGTYTLYVKARDEAGLEDATPATRSFTVNTSTVPTPIAPSGATASVTPTFQWSAVTSATSYQLVVYDQTAGGSIELSQNVGNVTSATPGAYASGASLNRAHVYEWKVRAVLPGGAGAYSAKTVFGYVPLVPVHNAPAGLITDTTPTLSWNATATATGYQISVYDNSSLTYAYTNVLGNVLSFTVPSPLDPTHGFKWRVRARNQFGYGAYTAFKTFGYAPGVPALVSPSGAISDTTPTLDWADAAGATSYQLAVYDVTALSYPISKVVTPSTYTAAAAETLDVTHKYRFKVRSKNAVGASAYTPWMDFCFAALTPTQTGPSGTIADTTPTYSWNAVPNATGYQVAVFDNTTNTFVLSQVVSQGTLQYTSATPLNTTHTYKWRVRALNTNCAAGAYSAYLGFGY